MFLLKIEGLAVKLELSNPILSEGNRSKGEEQQGASQAEQRRPGLFRVVLMNFFAEYKVGHPTAVQKPKTSSVHQGCKCDVPKGGRAAQSSAVSPQEPQA